MPPTAPSYRERLSPGPVWWLTAVVIGGSFGLVLIPIAGAAGLVVGSLVGAGIAVGVLLLGRADLEVSGHHLRAGRARIDLDHVGDVTTLDGPTMTALRGPKADARAYLCQRGWLPLGVRVDIADPGDPTPYWLLSSRRPALLVEAINDQRRRNRSAATDR